MTCDHELLNALEKWCDDNLPVTRTYEYPGGVLCWQEYINNSGYGAVYSIFKTGNTFVVCVDYTSGDEHEVEVTKYETLVDVLETLYRKGDRELSVRNLFMALGNASPKTRQMIEGGVHLKQLNKEVVLYVCNFKYFDEHKTFE